MSWKTLGEVSPGELVDARLQAHHALQIVASAGITFLEPQPDDSHPNAGWVDSLGALVGRRIPGAEAQVGLRLADLSLLLLDSKGELREELGLDGKLLEEGYAWLASVAARARATLPAAGLQRASYEIPKHETGAGAPFSTAASAAFAELGRYFADGQEVLTEVLVDIPDASELRCWPHHFDLGALVVLATDGDGKLAKSIGLGLSPGDDAYAEPYWYVSPWPNPEAGALNELDGGAHWHTDGHTSAILTASTLLSSSSESQQAGLESFLGGAIDASRHLLAD